MTICSTCKKTLSKIMQCSDCRSAFYCDEKCQSKDWPKHKKTCQILRPITYWESMDQKTADLIGEGKIVRDEKNTSHKSIILYVSIMDNDEELITHILMDAKGKIDLTETFLLMCRHSSKKVIGSFIVSHVQANFEVIDKQLSGDPAAIVSALVENKRLETKDLPIFMTKSMYCPRIAEALMHTRGMAGFEVAKEIFAGHTFDIDPLFIETLVSRGTISESDAKKLHSDSTVKLVAFKPGNSHIGQ